MKLSELCIRKNAIGCRICDLGREEKAPQLVFMADAAEAAPPADLPRKDQWSPDYPRWVVIFECTTCGALRYNDLQSDFDECKIEEK